MLILVFWNLSFQKHILDLLTLSIPKVHVVRISWNFKKIWITNFYSHTRPSRPASIFCFYNFVIGGERERFLYLGIQYLRFIRLRIHFEASICYQFFRVFLNFTVCSSKAYLNVAQTHILIKGYVFPICREKLFFTVQ